MTQWRLVNIVATVAALLTLTACHLIVAERETPLTTAAAIPIYVTALQATYGPPSQAAFGSAVFYEQAPDGASLEQMALARYRYFVGDLWDRYGEAAWLGTWQEVYARPPGAPHDIVAELRAIEDRSAASAVEMILDNVADPTSAQAALAGAFDDPGVSDLAVYNIGDGAAMSGILLAGRRGATGEMVFLIFLLD